jgi:hypothetical protein
MPHIPNLLAPKSPDGEDAAFPVLPQKQKRPSVVTPKVDLFVPMHMDFSKG